MSPGVLIFVLFLGILIIALPKEKVPIPMFLGAVIITLGQVLEIGSAAFTVPRILSTFAFIRMGVRGEFKNIKPLQPIDKLMIAWGFVLIVSGLLQEGTVAEFITRTGKVWDSVLVYFVFRCFTSNIKNISLLLKSIVLLITVIALFMTYEKVTTRNPFSILGGVPEYSAIREGRLRAQGPFSHPIMAGIAAASCIPLFVSLWFNKGKLFSLIGCFSSCLIIFDSSSSSPIMTAFFSIVGLISWRFKNYLKLVQKGIVAGLIAAEFLMKAHVWYLIARIDIVGGSTGYYRAELINSAIMHLNEWWLYGTNYTRHWMASGVPWSPNHTDITSWYISNGVSGGLPQLLIFIFIIVNGFKQVGNYFNNKNKESSNGYDIFIWTIGSTLFAHTISFLTNSYFDQIQYFWYLLIAIVANIPNYKKQIDGE